MTELQKWINQSQIQEAEILKLKAEVDRLKGENLELFNELELYKNPPMMPQDNPSEY